jgi:hypothetical protein
MAVLTWDSAAVWDSPRFSWGGVGLFPGVVGGWVEFFRSVHRGPDLAGPDAFGEEVPRSALVPGGGKGRGLV